MVYKWYGKWSKGFILALIINFIPMIFMGIVFGVMYYYTNSIWTPCISHFIINSVLNLVHVSINGELDSGLTIRMSIFQSAIFILIPILIMLAKKFNKVGY